VKFGFCGIDVLIQCGLFLQEAQKLLQPSDKMLRTMALELAEFQVYYMALSSGQCLQNAEQCALGMANGLSLQKANRRFLTELFFVACLQIILAQSIP